MRCAALAVLLLAGPACAQTVVAAAGLAGVLDDFATHAGDTALRCEVTPFHPVLSFAFRFQAGYTFHVPFQVPFQVPQDQYAVPTPGWRVLTKITPADGNRAPTFLLADYQPANVSQAESNFDIRGIYFLGVGRYSVESALRDGRNRICRKEWQVEVKAPPGVNAGRSALPPGAVRAFSVLSGPDSRTPDDTAPVRLSVLLNAAAFSTRRTALRPPERLVLLNALTALLERVPARSVRLVVFSLEQQQEVFRNENFDLSALDKVAAALDALQLAAVDVHVLQKPMGHVELLTGLVRQELRAPSAADTVVFLGPMSRYGNKISELALEKPGGAKPRFFYVQYQGPRRPAVPTGGISLGPFPGGGPPQTGTGTASDPAAAGPPPSTGGGGMGSGGGMGGGGTGTGRAGGGGGRGGGRGGRGMGPNPAPGEGGSDIISLAVSRLKGKTLVVHSPTDLAKAIRKIEGR